MFEAVIFDWDGTLGDTRQAIVIAFQKALSEIDCRVSDEFIERRIGIGAADTFRDILLEAKIRPNVEIVSRLVDRKSYWEIELADLVKLFPCAESVLLKLHGKVKMGLASMNNLSVIRHLLKAKGLENYFDVVLTAESISRSKPDPEIFLMTAAQLGVNPESCVVVEDSVFGVKAARSAGMGCVAVTTGVYSSLELEAEKPSLIVKNLCDKRITSFILG